MGFVLGGDGAITHELSDRLAEDLMTNERFEALVSYLDTSQSHLTTEWVTALFRLRDKELSTGRELFTPDMYAFAAKESTKMRELDWLDGRDVDEVIEYALLSGSDDKGVETDKFRQLHRAASDMYYAHSGIHSMIHLQDRLEVVAKIFSRKFESANYHDTFVIRQTANIHEELAFYSMLNQQTNTHLNEARRLNKEVVDNTNSWHYPYRMHALMSLFDLEATELFANSDQINQPKSVHKELNQIHVDFNKALIFLADQTKIYSDQTDDHNNTIGDKKIRQQAEKHTGGHIVNMGGVLAEALALSVIQSHILSSGLHNKYWVRQAFMREDSMAMRRLPSTGTSEALDIPNLSFDLQIFDYTSPEGQSVPIEVKKAARPSKSSLHPDIEVVTFKDSSLTTEFLESVRAYAQGQIDMHTGFRGRVRPSANEVIDNKIDPSRLFVSL